MTVSRMPEDMVVLAEAMDPIAIDAHLRRVEAMIAMLQERRDGEVRTIGYDPNYPKPRHTTTFGDDSVIVECSQQRDIRDVPKRTIRTYGAQHLYDARYDETETSDPSDMLDPSDIEDAIRLAERFRDMLARMVPDRERNPHPARPSILTGLAAYLMETGIRLQTQEVSLWTGRPYGLPGMKARDDRGDFRDVEGVDLTELDLWMPDVACMRERSFGPANLRFAPRDVDWRVDAVEMLRMTRRKAQRCSG